MFGGETVNNNTTKMSACKRRVTGTVIQSDATWWIRVGGVKASSGAFKVGFLLSITLSPTRLSSYPHSVFYMTL